MDLELLLAKSNFTTDDKHFLEDFVRTDENNSLKFGANNDPDLTQFIEDLEGRIIGRQSEISIYCFYSILCLYIVVILIGSDVIGYRVAKVRFGLGRVRVRFGSG